jgi:hypothetical protein
MRLAPTAVRAADGLCPDVEQKVVSMVVEVVSYVVPGVVVALWLGARRVSQCSFGVPALFAVVLIAAILMVPGAKAADPLALAALVLAITLGLIALVDLVHRVDPPGGDDDDDWRGGGGPVRSPPEWPRGGGAPEPDWWEGFEAEFWAHVAATRTDAASRTDR